MWQNKGFLKDDSIDVTAAMQQLELLLQQVPQKYQGLSTDELLLPPAPGKWSRQQVLGHLIDSAINNLKRFTDAQIAEQPYLITPYQQNELMIINNYQQLPLQHLLVLGKSLNQQIVFVVQNIPAYRLLFEVHPRYTQTLGWLICDYVAHMQHHLPNLSPQN